MRSIAIFGAGELGGALARQLAAADFASRVLLIDQFAQVAAGKALDIRQAAPIDAYSTAVEGTNDESSAIDADALVLADHAEPPGREWQDDAGVGLVRRLVGLNQRALILCAGGRQMDVVERGVREGGIAQTRLVGSAPEALRSAIVALTALEAGCAPAEVSLAVVGRPPHQIIVPWADASIGGRRATDVLSPPALTRLDARLAKLWPPGPLTLASAATRMLVAASTNAHCSLSAFVVVAPGEGGRGRVAMLPITLRAGGVGEVIAPSLSGRDRVRLETALQG